MKVRAIKNGFDGLERRREGEVFDLPDRCPFSSKWMVKVGKDAESETRVEEDREPEALSSVQKKGRKKITGEE